MLSRLYGSLARRRRRWYERRPEVRLRLDRPVVSVGALTVGGSGKTPITARLAGLLVSMGERPAVLSRGYARAHRVDGVVVVRDPDRVRAGLAEAGDEPLMLALALRDTAVLVAEDRHQAGRLAETAMGVTVHLLDDGFQHFSLHRDVDLLLLAEQDLADPRTLPGGRLREPVDVAGRADALIVETPDGGQARALADRLAVGQAFRFTRVLQPPRHAETQQEVAVPPAVPILAVAGIAQPPRFFTALRRRGYAVAATLAFRDHHPYTARDVARIERLAAARRVEYVVTTEKDRVRLLPHAPFAFPLLSIPLAVPIEPEASFRAWLGGCVERARAA